MSAVDEMAGESRSIDILGSFEHLKDALFRYYNTPFGLADEHLERERQKLCRRRVNSEPIPAGEK
jgi:hypothetical protein